MPRAKIVLADYCSRQPVGEVQRISRYDNTSTVAKLILNKKSRSCISETPKVMTIKRNKTVSANQITFYKYKHQLSPGDGS